MENCATHLRKEVESKWIKTIIIILWLQTWRMAKWKSGPKICWHLNKPSEGPLWCEINTLDIYWQELANGIEFSLGPGAHGLLFGTHLRLANSKSGLRMLSLRCDWLIAIVYSGTPLIRSLMGQNEWVVFFGVALLTGEGQNPRLEGGNDKWIMLVSPN